MIFKRLNRTSPEQVFAVFKANETGIAADDAVALSVTGGAAAADGIGVEQPTGSAGQAVNTFVGLADAAIANGAYGLVQIYGYRSTSRFFQQLSSVSAGAALYPISDQDYLASAAAAVATFPTATLLDSVPTSASTATISAKIFIRAM